MSLLMYNRKRKGIAVYLKGTVLNWNHEDTNENQDQSRSELFEYILVCLLT